jgi:RNase adaptor protein for sRNA GlmZ degradation
MKMFNEDHVQRKAVYIAAELNKLLDRHDHKSHMSHHLNKARDLAENLTNSEQVIATLRALSKDLTSLNTSAHDWEEEEV